MFGKCLDEALLASVAQGVVLAVLGPFRPVTRVVALLAKRHQIASLVFVRVVVQASDCKYDLAPSLRTRLKVLSAAPFTAVLGCY